MDEERARQLLRENASQYSSESQKNQEISKLITEDSDAMYDLSEQQIIVMSVIASFHECVLPLPQTMAFLSGYASKSRSRDRMGRQEFVQCHERRPTYLFNPHDTEKEEIERIRPQKKSKWSFMNRNKERN